MEQPLPASLNVFAFIAASHACVYIMHVTRFFFFFFFVRSMHLTLPLATRHSFSSVFTSFVVNLLCAIYSKSTAYRLDVFHSTSSTFLYFNGCPMLNVCIHIDPDCATYTSFTCKRRIKLFYVFPQSSSGLVIRL